MATTHNRRTFLKAAGVGIALPLLESFPHARAAGPRRRPPRRMVCIGNEFALMESQLLLTMILQRYRVRPLADRPVEPEVRLTLRPRGGLHVTLEPAPS